MEKNSRSINVRKVLSKYFTVMLCISTLGVYLAESPDLRGLSYQLTEIMHLPLIVLWYSTYILLPVWLIAFVLSLFAKTGPMFKINFKTISMVVSTTICGFLLLVSLSTTTIFGIYHIDRVYVENFVKKISVAGYELTCDYGECDSIETKYAYKINYEHNPYWKNKTRLISIESAGYEIEVESEEEELADISATLRIKRKQIVDSFYLNQIKMGELTSPPGKILLIKLDDNHYQIKAVYENGQNWQVANKSSDIFIDSEERYTVGYFTLNSSERFLSVVPNHVFYAFVNDPEIKSVRIVRKGHEPIIQYLYDESLLYVHQGVFGQDFTIELINSEAEVVETVKPNQ